MEQIKFTAFWAMNGRLVPEKLKSQLNDMKGYGFDGVIFHPRNYPDNPPFMGKEYLHILSETILHAKKLGLEFWIYDENGWPSGSGNGKVLEAFPDSVCQWMEYGNQEVTIKARRNFNVFCRDQMEYFIKVIYEGYRLGLEKEAFSYVKGFFSDEVGFLDGHGAADSGGIPWCREASERYRELYHVPLESVWENLFTEGKDYCQVRFRYWQILADILASSFYQPINNWCRRYQKRYAAHLKGEENLFFQIPYSGSAFWNLKNVNVPAVDALERYPGNHYYPRIAASVSRQFSDGVCMAEAFGGSGWGLTPEDFERYIDWLCGSGINRFTLHLWQYERNADSVRDWPPNIPVGLNWRECFPGLIRKCKEKWNKAENRENRTVVAAPTRAVMSEFKPADFRTVNEHNGEGVPYSKAGEISNRFSAFVEQLYKDGLSFDVTEERIVEDFGQVEDGKLRIGNALYDEVIASADCLWDSSVIEEIEKSGILKLDTELDWKFVSVSENAFLMAENQGSVPFRLTDITGDWYIKLSDRPDSVEVMGMALDIVYKDGCWTARVPQKILCSAKEKKEFCWKIRPDNKIFSFLCGPFLVKNTDIYWKGHSRNQVMTRGSFFLADLPEGKNTQVNPHDLLASGFPFAQRPVVLERRVMVGRDGRICFPEISADCVSISIDGEEKGFIWGPEWALYHVMPGEHLVQVSLYPSTFNSYGPHYHVDGDRHLTSPLQYSGEKGFADFADAQQFTLTEWRHFRKFGI